MCCILPYHCVHTQVVAVYDKKGKLYGGDPNKEVSLPIALRLCLLVLSREPATAKALGCSLVPLRIAHPEFSMAVAHAPLLQLVLQIDVEDIWVFERHLLQPEAQWRLCGQLAKGPP